MQGATAGRVNPANDIEGRISKRFAPLASGCAVGHAAAMPLRAADLSSCFTAPFARFEETAGGLVRLKIETPLATGELYPHGAHLTRFAPRGEAPVLFVSERSEFAPGRPIRGGVPVCFPWFAARAGDPSAPAHGFARTSEWTLESLVTDPDGAVSVVLRLDADGSTRAQWPHEFTLRHRIVFGRELSMALEVENGSREPFRFEEALHTYFAVSDVRDVSIAGLEGRTYLDKTDAFKEKRQPPEPLRIVSETDRIYPRHTGACTLDDRSLRRRIVVEKRGSATTVVWNPWIAKAAAMKDFGDEEWPAMICIEAANAGEDAIELGPGQRHAMGVKVGVIAAAPDER
jgi:glucose-6-phosphate 1-epimerase